MRVIMTQHVKAKPFSPINEKIAGFNEKYKAYPPHQNPLNTNYTMQ